MTYLAAQQQNKLIQFPRLLSQCWCSFQLSLRSRRARKFSLSPTTSKRLLRRLFSAQKFCHRLARSTYKLDFLFSNFGFGVLQSQKYCQVMFQCIECYLKEEVIGIRFQLPSLIRSLYFLILTVYLSYFDQVLLQQLCLLYIRITIL